MNKKSSHRKWGILLLILILLMGGAGILAGWLKRVDINKEMKPSIDSVYAEINKESPDMATLRFYVSLENFLPFDVQFDSVKYEVEMNDTLLAAGQQRHTLKLASGKKATVPLPLRLNLERFQNGKKPRGNSIRVRFHLFTEFPLIGVREVQFGTSRDFEISGGPALGIESADVNVLGEEVKIANIFLQLNLLKNLPDSNRIDSIEMSLSLDGKDFLVVDKQKDIDLGEKGQNVIVPARLELTRFRSMLQRKQSEDSMWINISGYAALNMRKKLMVRFDIDRRISVLRPPEITLDHWEVEHFALDTTQLLLTLKVVNENNFGLTIHGINYHFYVNDQLMAKERSSKRQRVSGRETAYLKLPMKVNPAKAGWTSLKVLLGAKPNYRFRGTLNATSDVEAVGRLNLRLRREGVIDIKKIKNK